MSGFEMRGVCLKPEINLQITRSTPTYGDCFNQQFLQIGYLLLTGL